MKLVYFIFYLQFITILINCDLQSDNLHKDVIIQDQQKDNFVLKQKNFFKINNKVSLWLIL